MVGYLWHASARESAVLRAERERLREEVHSILLERDSLRRSAALRADSIEALASIRDSLERSNRGLRSELWRTQARVDSLLKPDFEYRGDPDSLARLVERLLRERMGAAELE